MTDPSPSPWIIETTDDRFELDVLERSKEVPVVVDFWADWCQPCRMLGPILEQIAAEGEGRFVLVKANTEQNPRAAASFRVQSIPAVYGVRDGTVVDGFLGAMPPAEIEAWLQRFLPSAAEQLVTQADSLATSDPQQAEVKYREAIAIETNFFPAQIQLAQFLVNQGRYADAAEILETLERRGFLEPEAERVKAAIEIHAHGESAGEIADLQAQLGKTPDDPHLQLQLANAHAAQRQYQAALDLCLGIVKQHRGELREQARQTMVDIFRLMPADSELVGQYRRMLSMALY